MPLVRDPFGRLPLAWFVAMETAVAAFVVWFVLDLGSRDAGLPAATAGLIAATLVGGALVDGRFGPRRVTVVRQAIGLVAVLGVNLVLVGLAAAQAVEAWDEQLVYGDRVYETLFWLALVLAGAATCAAVAATVPVRRAASLAVLAVAALVGAAAIWGGVSAVVSGGTDSCDRFVFERATWQAASADRIRDMAWAIERCDVAVPDDVRTRAADITAPDDWFD